MCYEYFEEKLGEGANGQIYSIRPDELISKKDTKTLAFGITSPLSWGYSRNPHTPNGYHPPVPSCRSNPVS